MTSVLNVTSPRTRSVNRDVRGRRHSETDHRTLAGVEPGPRRLGRNVAAGAVVLRRTAGGEIRLALRLERRRRAETVVGVAGRDQLVARTTRTGAAAPTADRDHAGRRCPAPRPSARPSQRRSSRMPASDSRVERSVSVSSMRRINVPSWPCASSQLNSAVRALPTCRCPVGDGAKRTRITWGSRGSRGSRVQGSRFTVHGSQGSQFRRVSSATAWAAIASPRPTASTPFVGLPLHADAIRRGSPRRAPAGRGSSAGAARSSASRG